MIKTVHLKTAVATAIYYFAILALVAFLGVVVIKLVIWPPCSITTRNECVVDGWSIAGLAGAVLGVGGTILAVLGAVAVAAWWTGLDKKVDERVDERVDNQMKVRLNQNLEDHKNETRAQTTQLLQEQKKIFDERLAQAQLNIDAAQKQADLLQKRLDSTREMMLIGVMQQDPWLLDEWVGTILAADDSQSGVGVRMVIKYLEVVDRFFGDPKNVAAHMKRLENIGAPDVASPIWYWGKAHAWLHEVKKQMNSVYTNTAQSNIDRRLPLIEEWQKQHGTK